MELKTTDLRINSWVKSNLHDLETGIFSILSHDKIRLGLNPLAMYDVSEISGIELTKEWLINLGFSEILKDAFRFETFDIELLHFHNERSCFFITSMCLWDVEIHVRYVHQLQNIFQALTGKELTHQKIN